ncbi:unnamed protein product [Protopolystoma xenopodis]|uniref:Uncharacterized protein n=1 Tax=Protopolystoma xenopodis TaxID=117903 RepID=A0A448WCW1_9PLAT|nr:unnamed protein product [Protopolystoma xenopodis]
MGRWETLEEGGKPIGPAFGRPTQLAPDRPAASHVQSSGTGGGLDLLSIGCVVLYILLACLRHRYFSGLVWETKEDGTESRAEPIGRVLFCRLLAGVRICVFPLSPPSRQRPARVRQDSTRHLTIRPHGTFNLKDPIIYQSTQTPPNRPALEPRQPVRVRVPQPGVTMPGRVKSAALKWNIRRRDGHTNKPSQRTKLDIGQ